MNCSLSHEHDTLRIRAVTEHWVASFWFNKQAFHYKLVSKPRYWCIYLWKTKYRAFWNRYNGIPVTQTKSENLSSSVFSVNDLYFIWKVDLCRAFSSEVKNRLICFSHSWKGRGKFGWSYFFSKTITGNDRAGCWDCKGLCGPRHL